MWKHVIPVKGSKIYFRENIITKIIFMRKMKQYERLKSFVPTSDFMSSDFALAESVFFIRACTSSSLLLDGVLPFDNERTAGGAAVTRRGNITPKHMQRYVSLLKKEVQWLSLSSDVVANRKKQMPQRKERKD